jgi:hypothetical protein
LLEYLRFLLPVAPLDCYTWGMKSVAKYPGLMRRGTKWYLRVKVPKELVPELGRKEIWRSLETGNHRTAVGRYRRELTLVDRTAWCPGGVARHLR